MITEQLQEAIRSSGTSRYAISKVTGIDQALLCRFLKGQSASLPRIRGQGTGRVGVGDRDPAPPQEEGRLTMASVFKPKGSSKYVIFYFDENGSRRKKTGATDKAVTERIANDAGEPGRPASGGADRPGRRAVRRVRAQADRQAPG